MTVIAEQGHVEMLNTDKADGKFKITDGDAGGVYKLARTTEKVKNPNYSWWFSWFSSEPEYFTKYSVKAEYIGSQVNIDNYAK